jgi:hypothetical protein
MKENAQKIYTTVDYSLFKNIGGNRELKAAHVEKLKQSMQEKYLFTIIFVNDRYEIIDGQHRFEAIRALGLEVNYVVIPETGWEDVQRYNNNLKAWTSKDYAEGYADMGKKDYKQYIVFKEKWQFSHGLCVAMLSGATENDRRAIEDFKSGRFTIFRLEQAEKSAKAISSLKEYYKHYNHSKFVFALLELFVHKSDVFDVTKFKNKLKAHPRMMQRCATKKQYIELIEEIYNYRNQTKVNLRF